MRSQHFGKNISYFYSAVILDLSKIQITFKNKTFTYSSHTKNITYLVTGKYCVLDFSSSNASFLIISLYFSKRHFLEWIETIFLFELFIKRGNGWLFFIHIYLFISTATCKINHWKVNAKFYLNDEAYIFWFFSFSFGNMMAEGYVDSFWKLCKQRNKWKLFTVYK